MIVKPEGYDEAPAYTGESRQLPKGKYVCVIKRAAMDKSKNGKQQFVVLYDVAEGEQKGFFQKLYDADKKQDPKNAKWKGVHRQGVEDKGLSWFKGLITSIERSNDGFKFQFDKENNEKTLVGKRFGAVMYREQFEGQNGSKPFATKIYQVRSVAGLEDAEVPEDKLLDGNYGTGTSPQYGPPDENGFMNIPDGIDEELPFM